MVRLGVIADDFTGACDVGIQFKKNCLETLVLANTATVEGAGHFQVVVVDTESRKDPPQDAYSKVRDTARALKKIGIPIMYKKIDSTLRGNIGAELDAVMDELNLKAAVLAAAYPAANRTTVNGRQLLGGIPLEKTEFAHDPVDPIRESDISILLQWQTNRKVGNISLLKVREGVESLNHHIETLLESGREILVADAEAQNDLKTIAKSTLDANALPCGSAGLAEEISYWLTLSRPKPRVLVVSGSVKTVTLDQISFAQRLLNVQVLEPNLYQVLRDGENREAEVGRMVKEAKKASAEGRDVVIRLVRSKDTLSSVQRFGEQLGMSYAQTLREVLSFLGDISGRIIDECEIARLILIGGDTAISVAKAIGACGIMIDEEVLPGIPSGRIFGGKSGGLPTITKAGGFGREDALAQAIRSLKTRSWDHPN